MKAMVMGKFLLVALLFCVGVKSQRPSSAEFNLFCRIMRRADDLMYGPDYVYDENVDKEIIKDMTVFYNATTDDMKDFRQTLWVTKDFFEEHPPPTDARNRQAAHREIGQLIRDGEKKIEKNRELAKQVHKKVEEAKLSVAQGMYGNHVTVVPKDDGNLTKVLSDTGGIFNSNTSAAESCGNEEKKGTGKTLLNDFFCVCVGEGGNADGPCSAYLLPPKNGNNNCCKGGCCGTKNCCNGGCCKKDCCGSWTQLRYYSSGSNPLSLGDSIKKIEEECRKELLEDAKQTKDMDGLLDEYVGMIWNGTASGPKEKKFFGHRERRAKGEVTKCDGSAGDKGSNNNERKNEKLCVDYKHNLNEDGKTYNIPWHTKFRNYANLMKQAKDFEDQILKNRADLLLLKSQAWVAYSREKDDETSNLDDMNMSNLFDGRVIRWERRTMAEKKAEAREYIDVSQETTEPSQPSQPVQGQGAPGSPPHYILISSTETSQPSPKKTDEGKGCGREEPEVTVISSELTTQEAPSPSQGTSPTQQDPPTQSAKRLREENKTGE